MEPMMARDSDERVGDQRLPADDDQSLFERVVQAQDERQFDESYPPGEGAPDEPPRSREPETRHVPLTDLLDERDKRRNLEARVAQYEERERLAQQQQQRPQYDHITQPAEYTDQRLQEVMSPVLRQIYSALAHTNRALAYQIYGQDEVDQAHREFDAESATGRMHPAENFRVMSQVNPFAAAVEWRRSRQMMSEVGNDPRAYRERLREELLQDPEFLGRAVEAARAQASGRPITVPPRVAQRAAPQPMRPQQRSPLPPSINRQGPPSGQAPVVVDMDDNDLYAEMTSPNKLSE